MSPPRPGILSTGRHGLESAGAALQPEAIEGCQKRGPSRHFFAPFRKNNIVTGAVPLFRHAWRVPFCTTTSPRLR